MTIDDTKRAAQPGLQYSEAHLARLANERTKKLAGVFNAETLKR